MDLRSLLVAPWLAASLASPGPGWGSTDAISQLLVSVPTWSVLIDTTAELRPTERATRAGFQFFLRDGEVVGRTTGLAEGFNCEFKVRVRSDGVDLHARSRACNDRYGDDAPYTMLRFDAADPVYPFKRLDVPQKWWLSPRR